MNSKDKQDKGDHGGYRPGAGRKPTGRKRKAYYVTDTEDIQLRKYLDQLRQGGQ